MRGFLCEFDRFYMFRYFSYLDFFLNNKRYKFVSMLYKYCLLFGIFSQNLTQKLVFKTRKTI